MRREILALVLAAVVLAGCAYPAPTSTAPYVDFTTMWYGSNLNWFGIASIAILMSAFFVSIAYMLGSFFNNAMIINWAKGELLQVFASALIVGGLFWLVSMMSALSGELAGSVGLTCIQSELADPTSPSYIADQYARGAIVLAPCHIMVAQLYLEIMYENVFEMTRDLLITGSIISAISNFNLTLEMLPPPWTTVTFVPFASLNMIFETLMMSFDMLTKTMMLLKFQLYFLNYVWMALFPMLLVLGVILRTFWFSRGLGGLLIAIAIGIYVAFPLLYTLSYYILGGTSANTYIVKIDPTEYFGITDPTEKTEYFNPDGTVSAPTAVMEHSIKPGQAGMTEKDIAHRINSVENKNYIGDILSVSASAVAPVQAGMPTENNWVVGDEGVIENTAKLLIYATFIPFIALMGTISFIKGLSPLLGGDVEIAGITHLI